MALVKRMFHCVIVAVMAFSLIPLFSTPASADNLDYTNVPQPVNQDPDLYGTADFSEQGAGTNNSIYGLIIHYNSDRVTGIQQLKPGGVGGELHGLTGQYRETIQGGYDQRIVRIEYTLLPGGGITNMMVATSRNNTYDYGYDLNWHGPYGNSSSAGESIPLSMSDRYLRTHGIFGRAGNGQSISWLGVYGLYHFHDYYDMSRTPYKPATCEEDGNLDYFECSNTEFGCSRYIFTDPHGDHAIPRYDTYSYGRYIRIPALGHEWNAPTYEWKQDHSELVATEVCANDDSHVRTTQAEVSSEIIKGPTCSEQGITKYTATFPTGSSDDQVSYEDQSIEVADIPVDPNAHEGESPVYVWSKDKSVVNATVKCKLNDYHTIVENVNTTSRVTKPATATEDGIMTYTATFKDPHFSTVTATEPIPAKGDAPVPAKKDTSIPAKVDLTTSGTLMNRITASGDKGLAVSWTRIKGADGYDIFLAKCNTSGKRYNIKKVKTIKGNGTLKWTRNGLLARTPYKGLVKAYKMVKGKKVYVKTGPLVHAYTSGGTKKFTNAKSVTVKNSSVTLKKNKTFKIKGNVNKLKKKKSLMSTRHAPRLRYLSTNTGVATVSKAGSIKATGKGTCYIYVYAHNGVSKAVKVTVR